jgi:hypothetical protein
MVESSGEGVLSIFVYDKSDGLIISGHNIDYEKSAIYHSMYLAFRESATKFNFSSGIQDYYIHLKNKKIVYSGALSDEFLFTVIIDTEKVQLGYFKGVLLKKFLQANN